MVRDIVRAVTRDVHFSAEASFASTYGGTVNPTRLNNRRMVDPLESLAGAHPIDDVVVMLAGPVRVSGFAGWVLWLFLHAPGRTDRVQEPRLRAREWTISFFQNARFAALGMTP